MEERSIRVYTDKTFFTKLTSTISKMLIPTKIGINSVLISIKRNNVLKAYDALLESEKEDTSKKEIIQKKLDDTFSLYLEAIDKHIMDSIYKKVKNRYSNRIRKKCII